MAKDDMEIVSALRSAVADRVGKERFDLWFGAAARFELLQGALVIAAPNRFFRDWLLSSFRGDIEAACTAVLGTCPEIEVRVDPSLAQPDHCPAIASERTNGRDFSVERRPLFVLFDVPDPEGAVQFA